jgi:hypothetical protein
MNVEGIDGTDEYAECEESDAAMAQGAATAGSQGCDSGCGAAQGFAKVLNDLA